MNTPPFNHRAFAEERNKRLLAERLESWQAAAEIRALMRRFGITPARLRRHAWKTSRIPRHRVEAVLAGDGKTWNGFDLWCWQWLVSHAWQAD